MILVNVVYMFFFICEMRGLELSIWGGFIKFEVLGICKILWDKWNKKKGRNY